jgi:hypothetical protein
MLLEADGEFPLDGRQHLDIFYVILILHGKVAIVS